MRVTLLGKKIGMTQIFTETGVRVPITVIEVPEAVVTQIKSKASEGYSALQLGCGQIKEQRVRKAQGGLFKKANVSNQARLYELRLESDAQGIEVGDVLSVDNFEVGDMVDVTATSIGKGFQGAMKRHNFKGAKTFSHGDMSRRRTGSIGGSAFPSRVLKGMLGPGHMGSDTVTVQNVKVMVVDVENNLLGIRGAVPGFDTSKVTIRTSLKKGAQRELKIKKKNAASASETVKEEQTNA